MRPGRDPKEIGIYLIPTSSIDLYSQGVDLHKLCIYLNKRMRAAQSPCKMAFYVLIGKQIEQRNGTQSSYSTFGLRLKQRHPFINFEPRDNTTTWSAGFDEAKKTYIVDKDALDQINSAGILVIEAHGLDTALFVAIGSEVLSEDSPKSQFRGERTEDAYSVLSDFMSVNTIDNDSMADTDRPFRNVVIFL